MAADGLFDPSTVPAGVVSAAAVRHVNHIIRRLRARRVDRIEIQEAGSRFRVSNMIRAYNQAHLRRALMFVEAARHHVYAGQGLIALVAVRCVFETVANLLDFEANLQKVLLEGDLKRIHDFVHSRVFATRIESLIRQVGSPEVQARNILGQIDRMKKARPSARDDYDYLCEHAHPNAFGGVLYFGHHDKTADVVTFSDRGPAPEDDLKWVLVAGDLLGHLDAAIERIEAAIVALSEKARGAAPGGAAGAEA